MRGRLIAAVLLALALTAAVAAAEEPVSVDWTALLPPLSSPAGNAGGPQPHCMVASMKCIRTEIRRMRRLQKRLGCDHRAVFDTTYLELTRVLRDKLIADPDYFTDRDVLFYWDALFAEMYFRTVKAEEAGQPIDPAWQIAMDVARSGDYSGTADMLLGINAHVQNDMPFMLAAVTLRNAEGETRKPDHQRMNEVLNEAFERVVREVSARFDPLTGLETYKLSPATDYFGIELVRSWREGVWRNAERLVNASTQAERDRVAEQIHSQAALSAQGIAQGNRAPPGYRAKRDAYCAAA